MTHHPTLKLVDTYTTGARTYYFRPVEDLGWALCTVDDTTGVLSIVSDYGNWSHMWGTRHLGCPTLTHFLAKRPPFASGTFDYYACKLLGPRENARVLDADETIKEWRKRLCARRLEQGRDGADDPPYYLPYEKRLDRHLAREIWDDIGSLYEYETDERGFIDRALAITGFTQWISNEPWESTRHCASREYNDLTNFILPALAVACADTIDERATAHFAPEGITAS